MIWFFDRNGQRLRYEIRRAMTSDAYELLIVHPDGRTDVERVPDPAELLNRCAELAESLSRAGWREA